MQLVWFGNPSEETPDVGTWEGGYYGTTEEVCRYRVSTEFDIIEGRRMPAWLEVEQRVAVTAEDLEKPEWGARIELHDGAPKVVNIGFASPHGREMKATDFQRIRSAVYVFYAAFCADIGPDGEPIHRIDSEADKRIKEFLERRRTGRQRLKTDDYKRAAQIYRDNFDDTPTEAVAEAFGVQIRQGGNIVSECRRRGFLPPTKQGKKQA